jgi:hypothetical protein
MDAGNTVDAKLRDTIKGTPGITVRRPTMAARMMTIPTEGGYTPVFQVTIPVTTIPKNIDGAATETKRIILEGTSGIVTVSME